MSNFYLQAKSTGYKIEIIKQIREGYVKNWRLIVTVHTLLKFYVDGYSEICRSHKTKIPLSI